MLTKFENFFLGHIRSKLNSHEGAMFDELMQKLNAPTPEKSWPGFRYSVKLTRVGYEKRINCIRLIREYFPQHSLSEARDIVQDVYGHHNRIRYLGDLTGDKLIQFETIMAANNHGLISSRIS